MKTALAILLYSQTVIVWDKPSGMDARVIYSHTIQYTGNEENMITRKKVHQTWNADKPWLPDYAYLITEEKNVVDGN